MTSMLSELRITEIFYSLQGESTTVGLPTVFIRLTGCPLRCQYCDTTYAFKGGKKLSLAEIMAQLKTFPDLKPLHVCVTGGEPLAQPGCHDLLRLLCDAGYAVSIETSGALDISQVDPRVMIVMDLKTPASKEADKNCWANLDFIKPTDQIKFVLCSRADYDWACQIVSEHRLNLRTQVLFSPSWGELDQRALADWIVADRIPVRFQIQLHKILWNDAPGH